MADCPGRMFSLRLVSKRLRRVCNLLCTVPKNGRSMPMCLLPFHLHSSLLRGECQATTKKPAVYCRFLRSSRSCESSWPHALVLDPLIVLHRHMPLTKPARCQRNLWLSSNPGASVIGMQEAILPSPRSRSSTPLTFSKPAVRTGQHRP